MRDQLCEYVRLLFAGTPDSEDMQQEILQNTLDRYDDLIKQGKSPEAAYRLAIAGIGDINEFLGTPDSPATPKPVDEDYRGRALPSSRKKIMRATAIGMYILCVVPVIALGNIGGGVLGVCLMFLMIAVATMLIIIASSGNQKTEKAQEEQPKEKGIWSTVTLVVYLALSFATQAWYITWLVFPIAAAVKGLVKACQESKKGKFLLRIIPHTLLVVILVFILIACLGLRGLPLGFQNFHGTAVDGEVSIAANEAKNLEIDWLSGNVTIQTADTDQITIREASGESSKYTMGYRIDGDALQLSYSNRIMIFGNWSVPEKDLIITVPTDWFCEKLQIDGASMNINITNVCVGLLDLDGASCNVRFTGSVDAVEIDGASMDIQLNCTSRIASIEVDGASCDLELTLPKDCGFTVDVDGISYGFHTELPIITEGDQKVYGDKYCQVSIDGISCEVTICEAEATMNAYSIVYANDFTEKMLIESPAKQYTPGTIVILKTDILMDADLELYVDGQFICNQTEAFRSDGTNYWEFYFTMPNRDVTVELRTSGGLLP